MASLIQLNKKFSTVHCFESHIQLRRRHMGSKRATASRDLKRTPDPVSPWARRGAPHSWDGAHPPSSAFEAPPPSLPPEVPKTPLSSSPNSPLAAPLAPIHPSQPSHNATSSWAGVHPSQLQNWTQLKRAPVGGMDRGDAARQELPHATTEPRVPAPWRGLGHPLRDPSRLSLLPLGHRSEEARKAWGSKRCFLALTNQRHCGEHVTSPPQSHQGLGAAGAQRDRTPLPREWAAVVSELKKRPRPRSPSFTTPVAVMKTLAGLMSAGEGEGG